MGQCWIVLLFLSVCLGCLEAKKNCHLPPLPNDNITAQIRKMGRKSTILFKCERGYTMKGGRFAICMENGQWSRDTPICIKAGCQEPSGLTNMTTQRLDNGAQLRFQCEAGLTRDGPETIWCDGKKWNAEPPKCLDKPILSCDFEDSSMCGWSQDSTDDFDWTLGNGETLTPRTGPSADHTKNSSEGHYLYVESSSPQKGGDKARLISSVYDANLMKNTCLEFFYHMLGDIQYGEVGTLEVYVKPETMDIALLPTATRPVFHIEGNQGDKWIKADVSLQQQTEAFQIVFQVSLRGGHSSDIAIDDIRLYECPQEPTTPQLQPTPTTIIPTRISTRLGAKKFDQLPSQRYLRLPRLEPKIGVKSSIPGRSIKELPRIPVEGCPDLLFNGHMDLKVKKYKKIAKFSCPERFVLEGRPKNSCNKKIGEWKNTQLSVCVKPDACPMPKNVDHAKVTKKRKGSVLSFKCDDGFVLKGAETVYCVGSQLWSSYFPQCDAVSPSLPVNAVTDVAFVSRKTPTQDTVEPILHQTRSRNDRLPRTTEAMRLPLKTESLALHGDSLSGLTSTSSSEAVLRGIIGLGQTTTDEELRNQREPWETTTRKLRGGEKSTRSEAPFMPVDSNEPGVTEYPRRNIGLDTQPFMMTSEREEQDSHLGQSSTSKKWAVEDNSFSSRQTHSDGELQNQPDSRGKTTNKRKGPEKSTTTMSTPNDTDSVASSPRDTPKSGRVKVEEIDQHGENVKIDHLTEADEDVAKQPPNQQAPKHHVDNNVPRGPKPRPHAQPALGSDPNDFNPLNIESDQKMTEDPVHGTPGEQQNPPKKGQMTRKEKLELHMYKVVYPSIVCIIFLVIMIIATASLVAKKKYHDAKFA